MIDFVDVGLIKSTKGLKGEVKVKPLIDVGLFRPNASFFITPPIPLYRKLTIQAVSAFKEPIIVKFKEIQSIDEAQALKGHYLQIGLDELPSGYYSRDHLIGIEVYSKDGSYLGEIIALEESKAHDIFVIKTETAEIRFASVKEVVLDIDQKNNKMIVELPKGSI